MQNNPTTPTNPAQPSFQDDEIDLFELWNGLVAEKWVIIATLLIFLIGSSAYLAFFTQNIYSASAKLQVQQVLQVQQTGKNQNTLYTSIEDTNKTAALLAGYAPASISTPKRVDGILNISATGTDKARIKASVEKTIQIITKRHQRIFNSLKETGIKEVLPTELVGKVTVGNKPIKPKKALILAVGGVLGLMLGVFIALIRRAVKNRKAETAPA